MIGIYKITNTADNTIYIGKSKDIKTRFRKHRNRLNKGIHHNRFLQRAWDKYGMAYFSLEVLEECEIDALDRLETYYIYKYSAFGKGFNMSVGGDGCLGYRHTVEEKEHMKIRNKGSNNPHSRKVFCDNKVFETMRACAEYYSVKEKTMQKWLCGYRNIRPEFKEKGLRYIE